MAMRVLRAVAIIVIYLAVQIAPAQAEDLAIPSLLDVGVPLAAETRDSPASVDAELLESTSLMHAKAATGEADTSEAVSLPGSNFASPEEQESASSAQSASEVTVADAAATPVPEETSAAVSTPGETIAAVSTPGETIAAVTPEETSATVATPVETSSAVATPAVSILEETSVAAVTPGGASAAVSTPEETIAAVTPEETSSTVATPEETISAVATPAVSILEETSVAAVTPGGASAAVSTPGEMIAAVSTPGETIAAVIPEETSAAVATPEETSSAVAAPEETSAAATGIADIPPAGGVSATSESPAANGAEDSAGEATPVPVDSGDSAAATPAGTSVDASSLNADSAGAATRDISPEVFPVEPDTVNSTVSAAGGGAAVVSDAAVAGDSSTAGGAAVPDAGTVAEGSVSAADNSPAVVRVANPWEEAASRSGGGDAADETPVAAAAVMTPEERAIPVVASPSTPPLPCGGVAPGLRILVIDDAVKPAAAGSGYGRACALQVGREKPKSMMGMVEVVTLPHSVHCSSRLPRMATPSTSSPGFRQVGIGGGGRLPLLAGMLAWKEGMTVNCT